MHCRRNPWTRALLAALLACASHAAAAQVHRCTGTDGDTIFTDRQCADLGATEHVVHAIDQPARFYRHGCSRNLLDLVYEVTAAIDSRDVNRVAGVFDWTGMSTRTGYAVMDRLEPIAQRPLVDVVPVFAAQPGDGDADLPTTVLRAPIGLRLEQVLSDGATPARTFLGLRRNLGCWWVHL